MREHEHFGRFRFRAPDLSVYLHDFHSVPLLVSDQWSMSSCPENQGWGCSYAAHVRRPNQFVQLNLQSDGQTISQNPFRQLTRIKGTKHRTHKDGAAARQRMLGKNVASPLIIGAISEHKLRF